MAKVTTYAPPNKQPTGQFVQPTPRYNYDHDWRLERQLLQQEFTDITMSVMLAGGEAGADAMPPGLDVLVDWDVFNQDALDWMRQYLSANPAMAGDLGQGAYGWVSQLTDTTKRGFERELNDWIMEGASLKVLESRLRPLFGEDRARRIAVTEVTRIYAAGNEKAWKASGVVSGKRWLTAVDERVCPICGPLHNTIVGIDDSWNFTPEMLAANPQLAKALKSIGSVFRLPPAHVNCRCYLQPVIFEAMTEEEIAEGSFDKPPVVVRPAVPLPPPGRDLEREKFRRFEVPGEQSEASNAEIQAAKKDIANWERDSSYAGWHAGLSDEEKKWLKEYKQDGYEWINPALRGSADMADILDDYGQDMDSFHKARGEIDDAVNRHRLVNDVTLWRGGNHPEITRALESGRNIEDLAGMVISDGAYVSTSVNSASADKFMAWAGEEAVKFEIQAPRGTRGAYIEKMDEGMDEYEYLLARDTKLEILEGKEVDGVRHITARVVQ